MTDILIGTHSRNSWQRPGTTATLRIWFSGEFRDTNGVMVDPGNGTSSFYKIVPCTVNPTTHVVTIPPFTLPSTLDGIPATVQSFGRIYDASGAPREFMWSGWELSNLPTSLPFDEWFIFNQGSSLSDPPDFYLNRQEVLALINSEIVSHANAFISEIPAGVINGVNTIFTLSHVPLAGTELVVVDGNVPANGAPLGYTLVGTTLTIVLPPINNLRVYYFVASALALGANIPNQILEGGAVPEVLTFGEILDGQAMVRSGTTVIGRDLAIDAGQRVVVASQAGALLNSNLVSGGGSDDTAVIQGILDFALIAPLLLIVDGPALVGPLDYYSNTTIQCLAGGGFYLKNASNRALLRNANPSIGAITDKNISLIGGTYNGNSVNQTGVGGLSTQEADGTLIGLIQAYGVDNLKIHNVKCVHSKTIAVHLSNVQNFDIRDIDFDNEVVGQFQQGGLQIEGLCSSGTINGLRGSTQDDFLAFASDGANWPNPPFTGLGPLVVAGAITDITASNISATRGWSAVRLFNGVNRIDRVRVSNITGAYISLLSNDPSGMALTGNIGTFTMDGAIVTPRSDVTALPLISLHGKIEHLILRDIQVNTPPGPTSQSILEVHPGGNIRLLDIDGFSIYDTTVAAFGLIPMLIEGRILKFIGHNFKWIKSVTLPQNTITPEALILIQTNTGGIRDLIIDGLVTNIVAYGVYELLGYMRTAKLSNIHMENSPGGAGLRVTGNDLVEVSINNWYGEMAPPFFGALANPRKRGDVFPFETTPPTFVSASVKGGQDVVTVLFSEAVNAINAILGVTIKKNTVVQTVIAATRNIESDSMIDFQLSANVAPGDTVTWEYVAATGFITDWRGNVLADVSAQAVTNTNTTRTFDRFTGVNNDPLDGRTPSPTTTGGNVWATLRGTPALQTLPQNATMAELAAPFVAAGAVDALNSSVQSLAVDSGFADVIITCDAMMTEVNGSAGVIFRVTDTSNFWLFWITPYRTELWKVNGGVVSGSSVVNFHGIELFYRLEVTLSGNNITCKVNGAETIAIVDAFNNTATKHGIQASQGMGYFDNFLVVT